MHDIQRLESEVERFQQMVLSEEAKLNLLHRRYKRVQSQCYFRRYSKLRWMVEEATIDCFTDNKS